MRSTIQLVCPLCLKEFNKELKYFKRNKKQNRQSFCSKSCCSRMNLVKNTNLEYNITPGSKKDIYSRFRKHFSSAKRRSIEKKLEFDISLSDLLNKWDEQNGICALSGLQITIVENSDSSNKRHPFIASLDRKSSKIGYTKNNIQWVCLIGQFAKNNFDDIDLFTFCKSYYKKHCDGRPDGWDLDCESRL